MFIHIQPEIDMSVVLKIDKSVGNDDHARLDLCPCEHVFDVHADFIYRTKLFVVSYHIGAPIGL